MTRLAMVACALLASAGLAWAGSPTNPDWVTFTQGNSATVVQKDNCLSDILLVSTTDTANATRLTFFNEHATVSVDICPGTGVCTGGVGVELAPGASFVVERAADGMPWRCNGVSGTSSVSVLIEK
jgi:hypothetical protein